MPAPARKADKVSVDIPDDVENTFTIGSQKEDILPRKIKWPTSCLRGLIYSKLGKSVIPGGKDIFFFSVEENF